MKKHPFFVPTLRSIRTAADSSAFLVEMQVLESKQILVSNKNCAIITWVLYQVLHPPLRACKKSKMNAGEWES